MFGRLQGLGQSQPRLHRLRAGVPRRRQGRLAPVLLLFALRLAGTWLAMPSSRDAGARRSSQFVHALTPPLPLFEFLIEVGRYQFAVFSGRMWIFTEIFVTGVPGRGER